MQVGAEIVFDASIEIFNLSIALRMGRSSLGMFDVQDCEKLGRKFVDKFFSTVGVNLNWRRESVDPPVQDHLRHRRGFFVRNRYYDGDLGEGVGHAQDMFVESGRFERPVQINVDSLIWLSRDRQRGQRSRLGVAFAGSLASRTSLDVLGDVGPEGGPPPGSGDSVQGSVDGTVSG